MSWPFNWHSFRLSSWSRTCLALLCAPLLACADIVNIPTGPFEGQVVLTNLVFADWDEYYSYKQQMLSVLSQMESMQALCSNKVEVIIVNIGYVNNSLTQAIVRFTLWHASESASASGHGQAEQAEAYVHTAKDQNQASMDAAYQMKFAVEGVGQELALVRSSLESDATEYRGTFAVSAADDSSSGGCQCPDYTQILNYIDSKLGTINTTLSTINSNVQQLHLDINSTLTTFLDSWFNIWDTTYYYPIAEAAMAINSAYDHSSSEETWGPTLGAILGSVFKTNQVASTALYWTLGELESALANSGIWQTPPLYSSDSSIASALQQVYNPLRQLFAWDVTQHSTFYPAVGQILNFLWTRNVHPTNTFSNPLYVTNTSPMTLEITPDSAGSSEHPINVSVGNPEVVIASTNGVLVTNKVALTVSLDTYTGEDGGALNVNVINFEDLRDIFDDYFRTGSGQQEAEDDKEEENDESEEELDDDINADGRDPQFILNITSFQEALTKYRQMLNSIKLLIPDQTSPPRFYFDYSFQFSEPGSEPSRESSIEITPIGPDNDQSALMGRYLSVVRGFCSVIWLGVVLATGLWLVKWAIYGIAFATAISMTIASGDLASLARLVPSFIRNLLSAGDV